MTTINCRTIAKNTLLSRLKTPDASRVTNRARGASVIAVAGSAKAAAVHELGAREIIARGAIRPLVSRSFALRELVAAQSEFVKKQHLGKIVLLP